MTDEKPAEKKPGPSRRAIIGWSVGMFMVLGLAVGGSVAYRPLRLVYAIHRVRQTDYKPRVAPDKWLLLCLDGARDGNRQAMEAVVDRALVRGGPVFRAQDGMRLFNPTFAFEAARAQPELFFDVLDGYDDKEVRKALVGLERECWSASGRTRLGPIGRLVLREITLGNLFEEYRVHASDPAPRVRRVARAALDFGRRRFAKELAREEKHLRSFFVKLENKSDEEVMAALNRVWGETLEQFDFYPHPGIKLRWHLRGPQDAVLYFTAATKREDAFVPIWCRAALVFVKRRFAEELAAEEGEGTPE